MVEERGNMNVIEEITDVVTKLDEIDDYFDTLNNKLSDIDKKQQDILHYIEYNPIKMLLSYKTLKVLKQIRKERRKIKNDISLKGTYETYNQRLLKKENRQSILAELHKKEKGFDRVTEDIINKNNEVEEFIKGV